MTYCVAMNVEEGLVGLADSLITSGREKTIQRKVSVYSPPEGGAFFVMTSGLGRSATRRSRISRKRWPTTTRRSNACTRR